MQNLNTQKNSSLLKSHKTLNIVHHKKQNNEQQSTTVQEKIKQITKIKDQIENKIIETFSDLKKRIIKNVQKAQKKMLKEFAQKTLSNISLLKQNQKQGESFWSQLSQGSYLRKAESFYSSLKAINIQNSFKNIQKSIKTISDDLKQISSITFNNLTQITNNQSLTYKKTITFTEIVDKACLVNNKIIRVSQNMSYISCESNKTEINRKVNFISSIKMPQKSKDYLVVFSEGIMEIFNDKLVLIGKRNIQEPVTDRKIIEVVQISGTSYLFIIMIDRIIKFDLMNLNIRSQSKFNQHFSLASQTDQIGSLVCLVGQNKIVFISQEIEKFYQLISPFFLKGLKCDESNVYGLGLSRICLWNNFQLVLNCPMDNPLDLIRVNNQKGKFIITGNSSCFELISLEKSKNETNSNKNLQEQNENNDEKYKWKSYSKDHKSKIKQVLSNGNNLIYCLTQNGKKMQIYQLI